MMPYILQQMWIPSWALAKSETKILVQKVNSQLSDAPWSEDGMTQERIP